LEREKSYNKLRWKLAKCSWRTLLSSWRSTAPATVLKSLIYIDGMWSISMKYLSEEESENAA